MRIIIKKIATKFMVSPRDNLVHSYCELQCLPSRILCLLCLHRRPILPGKATYRANAHYTRSSSVKFEGAAWMRNISFGFGQTTWTCVSLAEQSRLQSTFDLIQPHNILDPEVNDDESSDFNPRRDRDAKRKKKSKAKENENRNVIPNLVHQIFSFLFKGKKSTRIVQEAFKAIGGPI